MLFLKAAGRRLVLFSAVLLLVTFSTAKAWPLSGADVAIYNDTAYQYGGAWPQGLTAIKAALSYYGYTYEDITPDQLNAAANLNSLYRMIIFGGGWAGGYNTYVSTQGFNNIRSFVNNGGGYLGICAGAYFAASATLWREQVQSYTNYYDYPLKLFNGYGIGTIFEIIGWNVPTGCSTAITQSAAMTTVSIDTSVFPDVSPTLNILYFGGPFFVPFDSSQNITVVGRYKGGAGSNSQPAMIMFNYGGGKVFLTGPHPEVSFNNCSLWYDSSTWQLFHSAVKKLIGK
ncbi:MAG: BPL-N domain-containing protein [Candidatus Magnetominusculus sp. LBB02]|nr:BPL-N domain-containing protein [Candidatus Magnetominusculus sp. LBB02]